MSGWSTLRAVDRRRVANQPPRKRHNATMTGEGNPSSTPEDEVLTEEAAERYLEAIMQADAVDVAAPAAALAELLAARLEHRAAPEGRETLESFATNAADTRVEEP